MEWNGLPLHPLAVHGAVVLGPLAALLAIAYCVPKWRDRLRVPMVIGALIAAGAIALAYYSGDSFREANDFFNDPSLPTTDQIDDHAQYGEYLYYTTLGFGAVALLAYVVHARSGALRWLPTALLAIGAVAVIGLTYLTGDAGARAVWESYNG